MDVGLIFAVVCIVGYLMLYVSSKQYLKEGYDCQAPKRKQKVIMEQQIEAPYVKQQILDVDDYEHNLVFQNEGDREVSKALINKLKSQYPMDWSTHPPSSSFFQQGLQKLQEAFKDTPDHDTSIDPYRDLSNQALMPPDTTQQELEERKILQTYKPKESGDLSTYNVDDAQELIRKIYDAKGLIPTVRHKENNVYEIIGTRRKDEKIVYEDEEAAAQKAPQMAAGEGLITVPVTAMDTAAGLDPFYSTSPASHVNRWDYQKFTPGLERMFAPSKPLQNWS